MHNTEPARVTTLELMELTGQHSPTWFVENDISYLSNRSGHTPILINEIVKHAATLQSGAEPYFYSIQHRNPRCRTFSTDAVHRMYTWFPFDIVYTFESTNRPHVIKTSCMTVLMTSSCISGGLEQYRYNYYTGQNGEAYLDSSLFSLTTGSCPNDLESPHVGGLLAWTVTQPPAGPVDLTVSEWQSYCRASWTTHVLDWITNASVVTTIPQWETDRFNPRVFDNEADRATCLRGIHPVAVHATAPRLLVGAGPSATADEIVATLLSAYTDAYPNVTAVHAHVTSVTDATEYVLDVLTEYTPVSRRSPRALVRLMALVTNSTLDNLVYLYPTNETTLDAFASMITSVPHAVFSNRDCTYTNITVPCPEIRKTHDTHLGGTWPNITVFSIGNTTSRCPEPVFSSCGASGPHPHNASSDSAVAVETILMVLPVGLPAIVVIVLTSVMFACGKSAITTTPPIRYTKLSTVVPPLPQPPPPTAAPKQPAVPARPRPDSRTRGPTGTAVHATTSPTPYRHNQHQQHRQPSRAPPQSLVSHPAHSPHGRGIARSLVPSGTSGGGGGASGTLAGGTLTTMSSRVPYPTTVRGSLVATAAFDNPRGPRHLVDNNTPRRRRNVVTPESDLFQLYDSNV